MKAKLISIQGKPTKDIELPEYFSDKIREDLAQKFFEISKKQQPYGPNPNAGKMHAASGKLSRKRHLKQRIKNTKTLIIDEISMLDSTY